MPGFDHYQNVTRNKEILKEIAWEELRTLSGQVEIILVQWLESEGYLKKEGRKQIKAV